MKREYCTIALLWLLAFCVGISARQPIQIDAEQTTDIPPTATLRATIPQPSTSTPELTAIPLGTFTPYDDATVYRWPNTTSNVVGVIEANMSSTFTSEYRHQGELWLCVAWNVDQSEKTWKCTGWTLAIADGEQYGIIERSYTHPDNERAQEQNV